MKQVVAATAITATLILLLSAIAAASPEKTDKFGCHKCTRNCERYDLLKNEYHCHGTANVQSQNIQIAPRIYGNSTYRRVASIIDGDTLTVYYGIGGKKAKVRLLGIDTPEASPKEKAECFSTQATQQLNKLAFNMFVLLKKDKLQRDDKDKYGRLLRYVILFDNTSVNEEMIKGGYAKAYPSLTTTVEQYKKLENEAKEKKLGMWGECGKAKKNDTSQRLFPLKGERYGSHNIN
ncbi:thermonuclease family protein [Candidatus Woesearchaeota archaeon]|nr:thermonuclease family protein [Candidatus Woesearchaeota archaeon]